MSNSRKVDYLSFLRPSQEALVLYRDQAELDHILFEHVKSGLGNGDKIVYLAGNRSTPETHDAILSYCAELEYREIRQGLTILTYDDLCLANGVVDLQRFHTKLSSMVQKITKGDHLCNVRLVTESNWWLWADVFEKGLDAEETHSRLAPNISSICTYRLPDLLDYTRIYHLAKLIELHRHAVWASSLDEPLMHRNRLLFDIRGVVLSSIHDLGLSLDYKKEASIDSIALTELIQCITNLDEVAELESVVESHLRRMFKV